MKFKFTGKAWDFFAITFGFGLLTVITFGIAAPFLVLAQIKFIIENTELIK